MQSVHSEAKSLIDAGKTALCGQQMMTAAFNDMIRLVKMIKYINTSYVKTAHVQQQATE